MPDFRKPTSKEIALMVCFAALYSVFSFVPLFKLVGDSRFVTLSTVAAPLIGIVLGSWLGTLSTLTGGIICKILNPSFSEASIVAGIVAALCASMLYTNRRLSCAVLYLSFLAVFGLYPVVGPYWLYPPLLWFQIIGFLILISPLQAYAIKNFDSDSKSRLFFALFVTNLISTLASQIAGSMVFEAYVGNGISSLTWQVLTFIYPAERTIIALISTLIGVTLLRALKNSTLSNLLPNIKVKSGLSLD